MQVMAGGQGGCCWEHVRIYIHSPHTRTAADSLQYGPNPYTPIKDPESPDVSCRRREATRGHSRWARMMWLGASPSARQGLPCTPYTLHPAPYTLHPAPYTLHPTPSLYTLHPHPAGKDDVAGCVALGAAKVRVPESRERLLPGAHPASRMKPLCAVQLLVLGYLHSFTTHTHTHNSRFFSICAVMAGGQG